MKKYSIFLNFKYVKLKESSLKFLFFFFLVAFSDFYEPTISEARRVGAPRRSKRAPKGRANQMKFDIFDKRPAMVTSQWQSLNPPFFKPTNLSCSCIRYWEENFKRFSWKLFSFFPPPAWAPVRPRLPTWA